MTSLEFTKNIILQLNEAERLQVVKRALQVGFTVKGFSKKPYSAPAVTIVKCLGIKEKGKYYYEIILDVIKQLSYEDEENELYKLGKRWIEDKEGHEQIENELSVIISKNENSSISENILPKEIDIIEINNVTIQNPPIQR